MKYGINKVIIVGNVGNDPEYRSFGDDNGVTNISVATSEKWTTKDGEEKEATEWHRVVFYRRLAEIVRDYLSKGQKVYVEGKLKTRSWEDDSGVKRYTTEIIADEFQFLDKKGDTSNAAIEEVAPDDIPF